MRAMLPILILTSGCAEAAFNSEFSLADADQDDAAMSPPEASSEPGAADTGSSTDLAPPSYWSLDGELAVLAGEIDLASSEAIVRTWDAESQAICAYELEIEASTVELFDDPDVLMFGWWTLMLSDGVADDARCADWPAEDLTVGIGEYDTRLDPALHARGWDSASVYGMYLQQAGGPLYLVGVSGTTNQLDGLQPADVFAPPTDGIYELHSVVLLDLSR